MPYLYLSHTFTFRFSVCNSIVNFYQARSSCKKDSPPTQKITNTVFFRIQTDAFLKENAIVLVSNCIWLKKKEDGHRVKYADGQFQNNASSTPILYSPCCYWRLLNARGTKSTHSFAILISLRRKTDIFSADTNHRQRVTALIRESLLSVIFVHVKKF